MNNLDLQNIYAVWYIYPAVWCSWHLISQNFFHQHYLLFSRLYKSLLLHPKMGPSLILIDFCMDSLHSLFARIDSLVGLLSTIQNQVMLPLTNLYRFVWDYSICMVPQRNLVTMVAHLFLQFLKTWCVKDRQSSLAYPQSNGKADLAGITTKRIVNGNRIFRVH